MKDCFRSKKSLTPLPLSFTKGRKFSLVLAGKPLCHFDNEEIPLKRQVMRETLGTYCEPEHLLAVSRRRERSEA